MPRAGGAFSFMDVLELTRSLVALETPTGAERPAIDLLDGVAPPRRLHDACGSR